MSLDKDHIFDKQDAQSEIELLGRPSKTVDWAPDSKQMYRLKIPPTVYPPKEDTDLIAKRLIAIGPGKGRKFLEIGCGSGALCIIAANMGWKVHGCDVNPFAVAASRGNMASNSQTGDIREGGVGPEIFPFNEKFDMIVWNLPYVPLTETDQVLGPMEEAAFLDTDQKGLAQRLMTLVQNNNLLSINGRILLLGRNESFQTSDYFAMRKWSEVTFGDNENILLQCLWKPYENSPKIYKEITGSTNDDVLNMHKTGSHVYTSWQTSGRGRRNRQWFSIEGCYAGSWIVANKEIINPGLIQLAGGLAVLKSVKNPNLKLKWPNDILLNKRKLCGILAEGVSSKKNTKVVLGIGINLKSGLLEGLEIASLDEIMEISHSKLDKMLDSQLASLLEEAPGLPPVNYEEIRKEVLEYMEKLGKPLVDKVVFDNFDLNDNGELIIGDVVVSDGEKVEWV